jgi:hypothetical protein
MERGEKGGPRREGISSTTSDDRFTIPLTYPSEFDVAKIGRAIEKFFAAEKAGRSYKVLARPTEDLGVRIVFA